MWAGTGESEESPASALDGDGQSQELGENLHRESGVAFTGSNCGGGLQTKPK